MATAQRYLAFDLGAESGRGILGRFDGHRLTLEEVGRFATGQGDDDLGADGVRRWDVSRIGGEITSLLAQAEAQAGALDGVGVDSWGVDFGLLDSQGRLLEAPVHYRDARHPVSMRDVHEAIPPQDIWDATGVQFMPFNTLYQLHALQARAPGLLDRASRLLMMPDLLHHQLTAGQSRVNEITNASTTQLVDPRTRQWEPSLLTRLGLPSHFLGEIVSAGTRVGVTPSGVPVYAPGTHDTASAVAATPAESGTRWAFLSSGTWSLLGVELAAPDLSREAAALGFSNELGVGGTVRFLKNIMGLWLVQECRRSLTKTERREYSYAELTTLAEAAPSGGPVVDATAHRFLAPVDMAQEIRAACAETGQTPPSGVGPLIRCCLDSLADAYRQALADLERLTGARLDVLHVVGGGSQNRLLNQLTASACGIPVIAGPFEATAVGNVLAQLVASGFGVGLGAGAAGGAALVPDGDLPTKRDPMTERDTKLTKLLDLSHTLGDPAHDWAILGEGNTSTALDADTFLVKASGSELRTLTAEQVSEVRFAPVLEALNGTRDYTDTETKDLLLGACVGGTGRMPSVETLLHAYLLTLPGIAFIGHTHVTSINGLLCSQQGWEAVQSGGRLFPDEIVVCGVAPCCVPYVDPGLPLARALRDRVIAYVTEYGAAPKTIYLRNHGFIALGKSAGEVRNVTMMADKAARILLAALASGTPTYLSPENVERIHTRPDEHYRQRALGSR